MRSARGFLALFFAALVFAGLLGLGLWQVQRLAWKTDLIARTEARLAAEPVAAPDPAGFAAMAEPEYLRLRLSGAYVAAPDLLVQALTVQGRGYWVISPFRNDDGQIVLINRGFVPEALRERVAPPPPSGRQTAEGLLRLSQPDGAFLRANDPAAGRWFSRDVPAMAAALGLPEAAPWFLDLGLPGAVVTPDKMPVPGLTVVQFRNPHLGYALTWFALAALWAGGVYRLSRPRRV